MTTPFPLYRRDVTLGPELEQVSELFFWLVTRTFHVGTGIAVAAFVMTEYSMKQRALRVPALIVGFCGWLQMLQLCGSDYLWACFVVAWAMFGHYRGSSIHAGKDNETNNRIDGVLMGFVCALLASIVHLDNRSYWALLVGPVVWTTSCLIGIETAILPQRYLGALAAVGVGFYVMSFLPQV